jgi:hypothetical protein
LNKTDSPIIGQYFVNGNMPAGQQAIFEFIHRVAPGE